METKTFAFNKHKLGGTKDKAKTWGKKSVKYVPNKELICRTHKQLLQLSKKNV